MGCPCKNEMGSYPSNPTPPAEGCNSCSSCETCESAVKICHFVVQTIGEARMFKNSYVVVQGEGNAVYHVDNNGNPVTVSRPVVFEANHEPETGKHTSTLVFDATESKGFIYFPNGEYASWDINMEGNAI